MMSVRGTRNQSGSSAHTVEYAVAPDRPAASRNVYAMAGSGGSTGTGGPAMYDTASSASASVAAPSEPAAGVVYDVAAVNKQMDDLGFDFSDDEISDGSDLEC